MPSPKSFIAALIVAGAGTACIRTDAGGQCQNTLQCGPGEYCGGGVCRSSCTSDAQCPAGNACTPTGECLRIDNLKCEEGDDPAPAAVTSTFPTDADLLLQSFPDPCIFLGMDQVPPGFGASTDLQAVCARLASAELNHVRYLGIPGQFSSCRPAEIHQAEAVWHEILLDDPIDTAMQARWSGAEIDFAVGHSPPEGGPPTPGTIWATGSSADGGHTVALAVDGILLHALVHQFAPDNDSLDAVGIGGPFRIDATFSRDAGGSSLVEAYRETGGAHDYDLRAARRAGARLFQLHDQTQSDPAFTLVLGDDLSGRLDDVINGQARVLCWTSVPSTNAGGLVGSQAHVVFSDAAGQRTGDPGACPFPELAAP